MRKKIIISVSIVVVLLVLAYNYVYKGHRNIASESASFTVTVAELKKDFQDSDSIANVKYLDKTIVIYGEVTSLDLSTNEVILNESLSAKIKGDLKSLKVKDNVTLKGRFIGYDDLLEEYKMDESTIETNVE